MTSHTSASAASALPAARTRSRQSADPNPLPADGHPTHSQRQPIIHQTFWQKAWVQNVLPLITSVTFHLTVLLVAALVIVPYQLIVRSVNREQIIIPEAAIVDGAPIGGIPNPGLGGDPNLTAAQNTDASVVADEGWSSKASQTLAATLMGGGAPDGADSVIGLGPRTGIIGSGDHSGSGGAGDGGPLAPFGVPGGGMGLGPRSPFMGISGNARRVVYICDASGSMMDVFPRVRTELRKAVEILKPIQGFNVIFFSDVDVTALSPSGLVMATPDNKRKAIEMAGKMYAAGTTDPLPAIRLAFAQQPELIYVLTDGFDQVVSFDAVINEFRRLNTGKKVKVNTILIRGSGEPELEKVVRIIASENGGVCRVIDRQDM